MLRNLFVLKNFATPEFSLRNTLRDMYYENRYFTIEDNEFVENSVFATDLYQLYTLPNENITDELLLKISSTNDGHIFICHEDTISVPLVTKILETLVKKYNFIPSTIWLRIQFEHQKNELLEQLKNLGIGSINVTSYDISMDRTYQHYLKNNIHYDNKATKRFSAFSRRFSEDRLHFFCKLIERDLLKHFNYTFSNCQPEAIPYPHVAITLEKMKSLSMVQHSSSFSKISDWIDNMPYHLGLDNLLDPVISDIYPLYADSCINVVIETLPVHTLILDSIPETGIVITEKTYKAILMSKPFIIYGPSKGLDFLKKEGYQTFSPYINESYSTIQEYDSNGIGIITVEEKIVETVNEIERLAKLSDTEFNDMLAKLNEIAVHNFNHFIKNAAVNHENKNIVKELKLYHPDAHINI